ncbi:BlaI/MecI/CopY family transcriptional regulator [Blastococcus sp. CT_GayMR16]|uniref:BlaI/MecI/CopY family transcriptional regulator n=1 Tax=Blastococcus sp. CT_GayMR16 TaxID=2559607 RepID=UPI0010736E5E|nr:BlaI/MecI/CopY family transcriptional regulator [Blastococcus sp. CT_GayMR16]TFV91130.1 BlaI/MecI/CopY family transcriptional regulator [Blastococcus sp. CT_GayMR16]
MPRLGTLEAAVMDVLWSADGPLTVRGVLDRMPAKRNLAYTTVMTVLTNLHRKGMADREPAGRAFSYRPTLTRQGAAAASLREILDASDDPQSVLLHFAETATEEESAVLRDALARRESES